MLAKPSLAILLDGPLEFDLLWLKGRSKGFPPLADFEFDASFRTQSRSSLKEFMPTWS